MNSIERKQSDATIKPKVLFLLHAMNVGGVEKALLGLLSALPIDKLNIHVGLLRKEGELLNEIPKGVTVHEINVYWYFVGDGKDKNYCEKMAKELGIAHRAIFVGNKANPYVYMRTCDVYVQPSRHEGFCLTLAEALCFEMPIVVTDFTGAREQLRNRTNSIVCGMGENAIAEAIVKGMKMPKCRAILSNTTSVKPFMELVEGSMA